MKIQSLKLCVRSATQFTIRISITIVLLSFIRKFIDEKGKFTKTLVLGDQTATLNTPYRLLRTRSPTGNELPLYCVGNLLDKSEYRFDVKTQRGFHDNSRVMVTDTESCQLQNYTAERLVACLDNLRVQQHHPVSELQLVFMGDSRIRQQFLNFVRTIPNYDIESQPSPIPYHYHGDIEVTSSVLGVRLSFRWQPLFNNTAVIKIRQLENHIPTRRLFLVILNIEVHHMLKRNNASYNLYEEKLLEFIPILGHLSNVSHVIWLNQFPTVDSYAKSDADNTYITSGKIHRYNKKIRRVIKGQNRNIRIWDSGNPLVEEYVRSCAILKHYETHTAAETGNYMSAYRSCDDYIHSGHLVLGQVTQILFNDICNTNQM